MNTPYTTVAEMSKKVNRLYELLAEAKKLASELALDNERNHVHLRNRSEEAINEERPLNIPQRISEAVRQQKAFEVVKSSLESAEAIIGITY
jgi:hypothetical protein